MSNQETDVPSTDTILPADLEAILKRILDTKEVNEADQAALAEITGKLFDANTIREVCDIWGEVMKSIKNQFREILLARLASLDSTSTEAPEPRAEHGGE